MMSTARTLFSPNIDLGGFFGAAKWTVRNGLLEENVPPKPDGLQRFMGWSSEG